MHGHLSADNARDAREYIRMYIIYSRACICRRGWLEESRGPENIYVRGRESRRWILGWEKLHAEVSGIHTAQRRGALPLCPRGCVCIRVRESFESEVSLLGAV